MVPRVPTGLRPAPEKRAATSLASAIEQLAGACIVTNYHSELFMHDRSGIGFAMGTCLAYLLAGGLRKRWRLETDAPSMAAALLSLISVPEHFEMEWRALTACIAMAEAPRRAIGAPEAEAATKVVAPILLRKKMATNYRPQYMWADNTLPCHSVLRMLVGSRAAAEAVSGTIPSGIVPTAVPRGMHFLMLSSAACQMPAPARPCSSWSLGTTGSPWPTPGPSSPTS